MTSVAESTGDTACRTEHQILALRLRGFQFINPCDERGEVLAVVGVRAHGAVIDVVRLNGEDDAIASRVPPDEDILAPSRVHWRYAGSASEVLDELLALPDP
jgi:hypothetical protein